MKVVKKKKLATRGIAIFLFGFSIAPCYASDPFAELEASVRQQAEQQEKEKSAFEAYKASQRESFEDYMRKFHEEFEEYRTIAARASANYRNKLSRTWAQPEVSTDTRWVLYEEDYKLKKVVDFENETISFSYLKESDIAFSEKDAREELASLLVMTRKEAFENDEVSQEIELASRQALDTIKTDQVESAPILVAYLLGQKTFDRHTIDTLTDYLLLKRQVSQTYEGYQRVESWTFPLQLPPALADEHNVRGNVQGEWKSAENSAILKEAGDSVWKIKRIVPAMVETLPAKARGLVTSINQGSREFELSAELILAIIETESSFNPMAKSPVPAYGLMQIVPQSAGQDATAMLFGQPKILSPSYLYNSENNIRIGSAYLNILYYRYFKDVEDPLSRLYSSIAAYNTGPGNVAKAMLGQSMSLSRAAEKINSMNANEVYQHLLNNLPYEETVSYLKKVSQRINKYERSLATVIY